MITYRQATSLDIPLLVSLERTIFPIDPWSVAQFKEEVAQHGKTRHYIVALDNEKIVGYAGAMVVADAEPADILTVAIAAEYRGQGIARHLLRSLESWAISHQSPTAMLEVRKENFEAITLYETEGYEKIAERQDYYGPGIDAIVMRKDLA
jgi:ribosomal-protein-alanine N-acetyltransferase